MQKRKEYASAKPAIEKPQPVKLWVETPISEVPTGTRFRYDGDEWEMGSNSQSTIQARNLKTGERRDMDFDLVVEK